MEVAPAYPQVDEYDISTGMETALGTLAAATGPYPQSPSEPMH